MELREFLFAPLGRHKFEFVVSAREPGRFSGASRLVQLAEELGVRVEWAAREGVPLSAGLPVLRGRGTGEQVAAAEEVLLGVIGKPSGVATAAAEFVRRGGGQRVVCGAWKKVAPETRTALRQAIATGGAAIRVSEEPFIYLDKNYVRMFGGVGPAVSRAKEFIPGRLVVVQLRGETKPVADEAGEAAGAQAEVIMIDTGRMDDLRIAVDAAKRGGWRERTRIAFAGGVTLDRLAEAVAAGADVVDVGRAIIDAPMLDFRLDVQSGGA